MLAHLQITLAVGPNRDSRDCGRRCTHLETGKSMELMMKVAACPRDIPEEVVESLVQILVLCSAELCL